MVEDTASPMFARVTSEVAGGFNGAWKAIGEAAVASITLNFEAGGRPAAWQPLAPYTVRRKGNSRILIETGRMMESTTYHVETGGVTLENPTFYGPVQHYGGGRIPARPWFLLQAEDEVNFAGILDRALQEMSY